MYSILVENNKSRMSLRSSALLKLFVNNIGQRSAYHSQIGVLGVPFDKGQTKIGPALAPDVLRNAGLLNTLKGISTVSNVADYGNVEYEPVSFTGRLTENMNRLIHFSACTKVLSNRVEKIINDKRLCLTLGGDHSIAVGSIDGHLKAKEDVAVIWVDAHADININSTSPSGNIHGMPVGLLLRELSDLWPYLPEMDWQSPNLLASNLAYIGLRDVDKYEQMLLEKNNIATFGMRQVDYYGIKTIMKLVLDRIDPHKTKSIHLSFDIDSLDTLEAPSTGTAVRGGLSLREGIFIAEELYDTGRLNAVDLVEVNPTIGSRDDIDKTVDAATRILMATCGYRRTGNKVDL